jgi:hypothetical protein
VRRGGGRTEFAPRAILSRMSAVNARLEWKDLDPKDQQDLEALASETGKEPAELLRELVHEALGERKRNGSVRGGREESFLEAAYRIGAVGCVKGGPTDVARNRKHMEGFGES